MARIDADRLQHALVREGLPLIGTMALASLDQLARRAEIARSMGVWDSVRDQFEDIAAEVEKIVGRMRGRASGPLSPTLEEDK